MISCRQARHLFDAFLDDELSPAMRTELHTHRLSCPECSRELALLEACADVVRTDRREPMLHEDFTDRVMVAFRSRRPVPAHRWRRIAVFAGSPLAAAAVLVFAFTAWFHTPTARHGVVNAARDRLPDAVLNDVLERSPRALTAAEREELEKAAPLPTRDVLAAWLAPAVERANNTFTQTQQSVSQLASFVRLGILPPETLWAGLDKQPAEEANDLGDVPIGPQFDSGPASDQHLPQPASTDKAANEFEVM